MVVIFVNCKVYVNFSRLWSDPKKKISIWHLDKLFLHIYALIRQRKWNPLGFHVSSNIWCGVHVDAMPFPPGISTCQNNMTCMWITCQLTWHGFHAMWLTVDSTAWHLLRVPWHVTHQGFNAICDLQWILCDSTWIPCHVTHHGFHVMWLDMDSMSCDSPWSPHHVLP